jgi:hypothetical protein
VDPQLAVYRHDVHKLRGRSHESAEDEFAGVVVNASVALGADGDAALLSRPRGEPEQTVENHVSPYRLSLWSGAPALRELGLSESEIDTVVRELVTVQDPEAAHEAWLESEVAAVFNESVYFPYTSLKYHVLLAAALLSNYHAGASFEDLRLVVDDSSTVVAHRTVFTSSVVSLRLTGDPGGAPGASLGGGPARSFAAVWNRLPVQALPVDGSRWWRVVDAQLRRIRAWSTALQYLEDSMAREADGRVSGGGRRDA